MKVLYGVNGEGMGHATRSEVAIGALLAGGHEVRVMASGAAFRYLSGRLGEVNEIFGPSFAMEQGEIRRWATVTHTMDAARHELPGSVKRWMAAVNEWRPEVVVTDFEPLSGRYARLARIPLVCVDNIHMIDRCRHDPAILDGAAEDFQIARAVTKAMVPTAGDYVVTTFFRPPLLRGRTVLVPPIVRPAIVDAEPVRGEHLVVYSDGSDALIDALRASGQPCLVYGMRDGPLVGTTDGAIEFRPRSVDGFLADLVTRARRDHRRRVLAAQRGGLPGQAGALGPAARPVRAAHERPLPGARGLRPLRPRRRHAGPQAFLERLDGFHERLEGYVQDGNVEALAAIEARVVAAGADTRRDRARARRAARRRAAS